MSEILHSKIIGKGNPLLILHGLLGMGDNWISLARKYANHGFEVHLIDQRNHGKSFHDEEMNYEIMSEDLDRYIRHHHLNNISLMGHSMGGKTAMFYAVNHPNEVERLIIVDIAPKKYPPHHHFIFEAIKKIDLQKYSKRKEIEKELEKYIESTAIRNFILKNLKRSENKNFEWKMNLPVLEASLNELGDALPPYTIYSKPSLFIKGEKSPYILKNDFTLIKAHFPQSEMSVINKSGHWVHAEQPEIFFNKTLNFLSND